jgi:hypothetical protein
MQLIEIIVIISAVTVVALVLGNYIYKKVKHIPTNECNCYDIRKMKKAFNNIRNELDNEINCCNKR